jgi:LysM repeat protein
MVILAVAVYAHRDFWIGRLSPDVGRTVAQDELAKLAAEVAHHTPQSLDERSSISPLPADEGQVAPIRPDQNVKTEAFQGAMLSDSSSPSLEIREEVETTSIETPGPQSWSPEAWFNLHPIEVDELADTQEIVVRKGETLSEIVKEHYGVEIDAPLLEALKEANEQLADPNLLMPGQSLILPTLGEQPRGFYSEPVGWFPDEATAAHWAEKSVEGEDAVFVVQTESEGSLSYGVFRGTLSDSHGAALDDGQMVVWVDESRVLRVFCEP